MHETLLGRLQRQFLTLKPGYGLHVVQVLLLGPPGFQVQFQVSVHVQLSVYGVEAGTHSAADLEHVVESQLQV